MTGARITEADLRAAFEKLRDTPVTVCVGSNQHVVHPKAEGWTRCGNCGAALHVTTDEQGRKIWSGQAFP